MTRPAPAAPPRPAGPGRRLVLRMSALDLPPLPCAVPAAREHARDVTAGWGFAALARNCELLVAELVTNAVTHGTPPAAGGVTPVRLRLTALPRGVRIEVRDASDQMPRMRCDPLAEGGRGLILVAAIAARWGACPAPRGGKCVFAEVSA
jgi:anti-sigma regulatory factor (Ser/Thr protein kinase)